MKKTCETVSYKGKTVVIVDLAGAIPDEVLVILAEAQKKIATMQPKSVLILTDASEAVYNSTSSKAMKEFSAKNTPYVKASAVVGADGLRGVLLRAVAALTRREIKSCKDRTEAMDWLVSHN
jgi:hypothetical protein